MSAPYVKDRRWQVVVFVLTMTIHVAQVKLLVANVFVDFYVTGATEVLFRFLKK